METIKVRIEWLDNYGAASEEILGCVATSDTLEGVKQEYASAVEFHLEGMRADGDKIPTKLQGEYRFEFELNAQALLKYLDGKVTRAAISRATGIAEAQLSHYIKGHKTPRTAQEIKIKQGLKSLASEIISVV